MDNGCSATCLYGSNQSGLNREVVLLERVWIERSWIMDAVKPVY